MNSSDDDLIDIFDSHWWIEEANDDTLSEDDIKDDRLEQFDTLEFEDVLEIMVYGEGRSNEAS